MRIVKTVFVLCALLGVALTRGEDSSVFSPAPPEGSVLWLDAGDATTVVADGGNVRQWKDKSGLGHDVSQPAEENRPAIRTGSHGLKMLSFDGEGLFFTGPAVLPAGQQQYTFFVTWRPRNIEGDQSVVEQAQQPLAANTRAALLEVNGSYGFNGESNDCHTLVPLRNSAWRITSMQIDNTQAQNLRISDNGKIFSGATGNPGALHLGTSGLSIGRKLATDGEYFCGDIGEIAVYPCVLAESDQQKMLQYLTRKWGPKPGDDLDGAAAKISTDVLYDETYRPQFHFTAQKNWLNDPNGLVYYAGEYHLFFQHDLNSVNPRHMAWGHAVSTDLVHWKQLDNAVLPDQFGDIWSGSAVVDWNNTSGFQTGVEKPLVLIYTAAGKPFTQRIAYSNDRGRTWTKYDKNPVLPHIIGGDRDPKLIWHEPTKQWIMALYMDGQDYALFTSPNLKAWTKLQNVPPFGNGECPDFYPMPVDGDASQIKWIFSGANSHVVTGDFDGHKLVLDSPQSQRTDWGKNYYAAQTYSDIPAADGRRIQIGWMQGGKYPGMPFNQQMSFPGELKLKRFPEGLRLCRTPVKEIELLHNRSHAWKDLTVRAGENPLKDISGDLFDIRLEVMPGENATFGVNIRGHKLTYHTAEKKLTCLGASADVPLEEGRITLQILVDRASIEVYANAGRVVMSSCFVPAPDEKSLDFFCKGGTVNIKELQVFELHSAWH